MVVRDSLRRPSCDTMGGIRFCGSGCQSKNPFVSFGAKPTQRAAHQISHETGRRRGKEGPRDSRQDWTFSRREQQRPAGMRRQSRKEGHSQQKGAEQNSQQNRSDKRRESGREETSQQKSERRLLGPVDIQIPSWPTQGDESAFLVALWKFRANTRPR